jgi:hypothetical protein
MREEIKRKICFEGKKFNARLGAVHWKDAMICIKASGTLHEMADCISIGFVCVDKEKYVVIHNFVEETPDDYILIPKQWTISVYYLRK